VKLAVGDVVVYGAHGIGRVAARTEQIVQGAAQEAIVVELADGLTVTLPLTRAREQLRPAASRPDVDRIQKVLREDHVLSTDAWLSRRDETTARMAGGGVMGLAQIVSEGAQRERDQVAKGKSGLSPGERGIFDRARELLAREIALALSIPQAAADSWIEEQLAWPGAAQLDSPRD
jgi:CarD family transcriptional regulator